MYLHNDDKELLHDIIITVSEQSGIEECIENYIDIICKIF